MLSPLVFNVSFAAILLVVWEKLSENADILADLAHLQEQPSKAAPETALECVRRAIWAGAVRGRRVHHVAVAARDGADDGGLRRNFRLIWSGHLREQDGGHVRADSTFTGNEGSLQRHGAAVPPDNTLQLFKRRRH